MYNSIDQKFKKITFPLKRVITETAMTLLLVPVCLTGFTQDQLSYCDGGLRHTSTLCTDTQPFPCRLCKEKKGKNSKRSVSALVAPYNSCKASVKRPVQSY